ncbi:MAG: hypothetical protein NZM31_15875 [Gemmatales bacterium]|nr:hypothetical protein [Gemmatales bacterium]MDW8388477.1 hypothetical protein [Gemmatales bacterium]
MTGRLEEVPADQRRPAERAADSERNPADDIQLPKNESETNSNQNDKSSHSILRFTDIVVTTWLEPDGRAKHEYRAGIMSDREFELIGSLPESIRLETVHLGPTTLPPTLQIAVPRGNSVLRLTYFDEANRWQFLGIHQVSLPTWQDAALRGLCRHRVILSSGQALAYPPAKDTRNSLQNWLRGWSDEAGPELARVLSRNATLDGEEVPDTGTLASRVRIVDQSDSVGLTLIVIPRWVLHGMGMALMVGLTGSACRLRKGRWWTMAGAVLVCLTLLFALPSDLTVLGWWMLIGCLLAGFLILRKSQIARTDIQRMVPLAAGSVALCFLLRPELALVLPAQEGPRTGPHLVFVLREERGVGEAERLLVPYPLLQKLRSLASAGVDPLLAPGGAAPLMLSADYVGQVDESFARFSVIYDVHWPGQKPGEWVVPLSGVRLQEASVDGTVAEVHWEKDRGWVVPLSGAGSHRVEMKFQVPVTAERGFGELRFGIPAAAASRCRIGLPGGLVEPRLHGIRGRQLLISDNSGRWLEADLGRTTEINLKWLDGNTAESPGDLRQAYLFELSPHEWKVRGWVHPVAGRVRLPWPQAWHLQAVTPATSRWQLEEDGAKRWLVVEGSRPFQVEASVRPWADDAGLLHLPLPDVASGSRLIGCRISGFSVEKIIQPRRLTEGDEAARLWPTELGNRPDFLLLAEGKQPAELVLRLRPERTGAEVTPTYRLRPEATGAEVQVRLDCRVRRGGPAFMTFDLPEDWLVADVQGSDLSRWTRLGRRLEIWLKHLEGERTQLELRAWIPAVQRDGQSLLSLKPLLAGSFEAAPNNSAPGALSSTTSPGGDRQRGETALGLGRLEVLPGEADLRLTPSRLDGVSEAGDGYRLDRPDFLAVWRLDRER